MSRAFARATLQKKGSREVAWQYKAVHTVHILCVQQTANHARLPIGR